MYRLVSALTGSAVLRVYEVARAENLNMRS